MATTTVEIYAYPTATTATIESRGGTGTPAASYPVTQLLGSIATITVPESLVGRFTIADNYGATTDCVMSDIDGTIQLSHPLEIIAHGGPGPWTTGSGGGSGPGVYSLTVLIESTSGLPIAGARVGIEGTGYSGTTNASGEVVFNLDADDYTLLVVPPSGFETPPPVNVTVPDTDEITIVLTASTPSAIADPTMTIDGDCVPVRHSLGEIWQGDDYIVGARAAAYTLDFGARDMNGSTGMFRAIRQGFPDETIEAPVFVVEHPDSTPDVPLWLMYFELPRSVLGVTPDVYDYDCELILPGDGSPVITVLWGTFALKPSRTELVP